MIHLRQLIGSDFADLHASCYPAYGRDWIYAMLGRSLERQSAGRAVHLIATWHGQVAGHAQLLRHGSGAEIAEVVVAARCRGRGIGTALIKSLLERAGHEGYPMVEIVVKTSNLRARRLYERIGFEWRQTINLPTGETADVLERQPILPDETGIATGDSAPAVKGTAA